MVGPRGKIAADTTIEQCSLRRTKATGHFLVDLGHPYIPLRLIVGKGNCGVGHEGEDTVFVLLKALPEVAALCFGHSATLFLAIISRLSGLWWRTFFFSFCNYPVHLREGMSARQKSVLVPSESASIFTRRPLAVNKGKYV